MSKQDIPINAKQRDELERIWFVYGNHGPKHTMSGHKFIQKILEKGQDWRGLLNPPDECLRAAEAVLTKLQVGDTVVIPDRFPLRHQRQSRANVILAICPEPGREYLVMTKILKNGEPSQDFAAAIYWHLESVHHLERMKK